MPDFDKNCELVKDYIISDKKARKEFEETCEDEKSCSISFDTSYWPTDCRNPSFELVAAVVCVPPDILGV